MRTLLFLLFLVACWHARSQSLLPVYVDGKLTSEVSRDDSLSVKNHVSRVLQDFWKQGYLFAGVDSINAAGIFLHRGNYVKNTRLKASLKAASKALRDKANQGYPFAILRWDSVRFTSGTSNALTFRIDNGPFILNDSLVLLSAIKTKPAYLSRVLEFEEGQPYNEHAYRSIGANIQRVPFLEMRQKPDVSFQGGGAWTYLDLSENATGSFQGIVGMLPNQGTSGGVLLTGNIDFRLDNLFRSGKMLSLKWAKFAEQSQRLDVRYRHPYVAGTNWNLQTELGIFRQDSSFLTQRVAFDVGFYLSGAAELYAGVDQETAAVLSKDESRITANNWVDFDQMWYKLGIRRLGGQVIKAQPYKDYYGELAIGTRDVRINPVLSGSVYDTISTRTIYSRIQAELASQSRLAGPSFIYARLVMQGYFTDQVPVNQMFRLGGLQSLRGFNEQFFFAKSYALLNVEWRYFFEETSYFFTFIDQGVIQSSEWNWPTGLGGGFSLQTNAGLFSFAMAMGRSDAIPLAFSNMKVHFGYLSRF